MHRLVRRKLDTASGRSEYIVAVNLDIRGFSAFSKRAESPDCAMFIKRVYIKLLDKYFGQSSFFKLTGDGLLLTIPYGESTVKRVVRETLKSCQRVLKDFPNFCDGDPMVVREVPRAVGIGLAKGTACRISSGRTVLDYSGHVLNLASRLMDVARPSGIVFEAELTRGLFSDSELSDFSHEKVFLKGIAEKDAVDVYYTKHLTKVADWHKKPIGKATWATISDTRTLKEIRASSRFIYDLPNEPAKCDQIVVKVTYPAVEKGSITRGFERFVTFKGFTYYVEAGIPMVAIDFLALSALLIAANVKDPWKVRIEIRYPEK